MTRIKDELSELNGIEIRNLRERIRKVRLETAKIDLSKARNGKKVYYLIAAKTLLDIGRKLDALRIVREIDLSAKNVAEFYDDYTLAVQVLTELGYKNTVQKILTREAEETAGRSAYKAALMYLEIGLTDRACELAKKMESYNAGTVSDWSNLCSLYRKLGEKGKAEIARTRARALSGQKWGKPRSREEVKRETIERWEEEAKYIMEREDKDLERLITLFEFLEGKRGLSPEEKEHLHNLYLQAGKSYRFSPQYSAECYFKGGEFYKAVLVMAWDIAFKEEKVKNQQEALGEVMSPESREDMLERLRYLNFKLASSLQILLEIRKQYVKQGK